MEYRITTPEQAGISSRAVQRYLACLEEAGLSTHNILLARGDKVLFELYYPPFTQDYLHREYSQTKSIIALAVGFALQEGRLSLDDPIGKFFPKETEGIPDPLMGAQTVRQMLMMSTPKAGRNFFQLRSADRVADYFRYMRTAAPLGSRFFYDSTGSFILGAMVERLTGMPLLDYLRPRLLEPLGITDGIHFLQCPGGHSWGDSALLASARDMMKLCRFVLDDGCIDGRPLLDASYVRAAKSRLIETADAEPGRRRSQQGYGYQIWKLYGEGFYFNGMGCQFSVAVPEKDLVFVYNGDNQGIDTAGDTIIDGFYEQIVGTASDTPLPEDPGAKASLDAYATSLKLMTEHGAESSPAEAAIDSRTYTLAENPMGIRTLRLTFDAAGGRMIYVNAQGEKTLRFGRCENVFQLFPEEGYSRGVGATFCPGNYYQCAVSGAWAAEDTLRLNVQVIDEYFGRLWITLRFGEDGVDVRMTKTAEDFFGSYTGSAHGV